MKKIIGVALFFAISSAQALAGPTVSSHTFSMAPATHVFAPVPVTHTAPLPKHEAQPARSAAPPRQLAIIDTVYPTPYQHYTPHCVTPQNVRFPYNDGAYQSDACRAGFNEFWNDVGSL